MGRTLPTSTMLIQEFEDSWRPYARALRKQDCEALAELFAMVRFQSAAIAYASRPDPFQAFMLAMLGGILRRVMRLEQVLEAAEDSSLRACHCEERFVRRSNLAPNEEGQGDCFVAQNAPRNDTFGSWPDGHPSARDWSESFFPDLLPAFAESVSSEAEPR